MYNGLLTDDEDQYTNYSDGKKSKHCKPNFSNSFLDAYSYVDWFVNPNDEEPNDKTLKGNKEKVKIESGDLPYVLPEQKVIKRKQKKKEKEKKS